MGLSTRLRAAAARRPAVLPVTLPGATRQRLALEAELGARGRGFADSPAAASALVVCGVPGAGHHDVLAAVWAAVPGPKAYAVVRHATRVGDALADVRRDLTAGGDSPGPVDAAEHGRAEYGHGHAEHEHGHAEQEHGQDHGHDHDHAQEHGQHHAHHHGGLVAGLPMADRADDRDGLRLDRLHLTLGPALPDWPVGLMVDIALQGDVIQEAAVRWWASEPPADLPFWTEPWLQAAHGLPVPAGAAARRSCAAHLDSLARLLSVAGWPQPAARARHLRDALLGGAAAVTVAAELRRFVRTVRRSAALRHLTTGLGELPSPRAESAGLTGPAAAGDVHRRVLAWLDAIEADAVRLDDRSPLPSDGADGPRGRLDGRPPSQALLDVLPGLLVGTEFACARLIVASLDPDVDEVLGKAAAHG